MKFENETCKRIFEEGFDVDFHWVTDSIYHQELQPLELYITLDLI